MKKIIVACVVLALGSVVTIHAQKKAPPLFPLLNGEPGRVVVGPGGGFIQVALPLEARVVKGLPYSAEIVTESIQTLADGNRIVQRTTGRVYRDSEGRVRREEDRPPGGPTISITDSVAGTTFTLDPVNRTARETPTRYAFDVLAALKVQEAQEQLQKVRELVDGAKRLAEAQGAGGRGPTTGVAGGGRGRGKLDGSADEKLPDHTIEGVIATGVRRTTTIDKGAIGNDQPIKIVSEEWTSPELQVLVMTDHNDPRTGRSTYRLLRINRADLDPALFQVPPDYTIQRGPGLGGRGARGEGAGGRGGRGQ